MGEQRLDLPVDVAVDVLDVVDAAGLEAQQRRGSVGRDAELGKEVGIPRRDDAVGDEQSRVTMIRVDAVRLPRVVTEDDVGAALTDHAACGGTRPESALELAVDVPE